MRIWRTHEAGARWARLDNHASAEQNPWTRRSDRQLLEDKRHREPGRGQGHAAFQGVAVLGDAADDEAVPLSKYRRK